MNKMELIFTSNLSYNLEELYGSRYVHMGEPKLRLCLRRTVCVNAYYWFSFQLSLAMKLLWFILSSTTNSSLKFIPAQ